MNNVKNFLCVTAVLFSTVCILLAAQNNEQSLLLEKATAVVDRDGKHGISEALELIEKAIAVNPSSDMPYIAAARVCLFDSELNRNGKSLDRALEYVNRAVKVNPLSAEARTCKAQILLDKKSDSEAVYELQKALKDEPGNLNANITYMAYLSKTGRRKQAAAFAEESLGKVSDKAAVAKTYGKLMLNAGFWEETLGMFEKATAGGPISDPEILKGSAFALAKLGRYAGAANVYTYAYEAEPENKQLLIHISICHEKAGNLEKSASYLGQYVSLFPKDADALKKLARLYDKLGNDQAAEETRKNLKAMEKREE
ncbi:MAG: tetratricopeptide repeat protein [Kiritimatiellae bacterium]|nr:tetratricopeptide repeat protein [Kiritimatiellia bacterium]MDD5519415.1 tetratricopeptide repeat protein [Kiritimatiellia bacterium]